MTVKQQPLAVPVNITRISGLRYASQVVYILPETASYLKKNYTFPEYCHISYYKDTQLHV
jgi:hypothetical protein